MKVPIPRGDVELTPAGVGYAFADERLEQLTPAQKQLLRMGPENVKKVQDKLREIAGHLGIEATTLTAPTGVVVGTRDSGLGTREAGRGRRDAGVGTSGRGMRDCD